MADHVFRDSGLTDVDAEFQQFAMDPWRAPTRVRLRHGADQRADVRRHGRSPHAATALPGPPQPKAPSVPGDDGLRLDDDERRSPFGPETREHDPEPTVRLCEPQPPRPRALQHLQLVLRASARSRVALELEILALRLALFAGELRRDGSSRRASGRGLPPCAIGGGCPFASGC